MSNYRGLTDIKDVSEPHFLMRCCWYDWILEPKIKGIQRYWNMGSSYRGLTDITNVSVPHLLMRCCWNNRIIEPKRQGNHRYWNTGSTYRRLTDKEARVSVIYSCGAVDTLELWAENWAIFWYWNMVIVYRRLRVCHRHLLMWCCWYL